MTCLGCGHDNPPQARYCNHCGSKLATAPLDLPSTRIPKDELKIATVLFADLSGFTSMAERHQPELVADVLRHCFDGIERAIRRFGGTVVKYVGDSVIGSFGVPTMLEDHALRALLASQEILAFMESYNRDLERRQGWSLSWRIGMHAGDVWVGQMGGKLDLVGSTVNLANRLEQNCPPGHVLVSETVKRLVHDQFAFESVGPIYLKGFERPLAAYLLRGRRDPEPETYHVPLIGREFQLNRLEVLVGRLYSGIGGSVAVTGEAGVGKSRLLAELRRRSLVQHPFDWLEAKGESWAQQVPYGLLAKILRRYWPLEEDDSGPTALRSCVEAAAQRGTRIPLETVFTTLKALFDDQPEVVDESRRDDFGRVLRTLIHGEAVRRGGIVLVLDDLQWADEPSLHALSYLFPGLSRVPLLIVTLFRPTATLWGRLRGAAAQELPIPPLNDQEGLTLLRAQLGDSAWSDEVLGRIVARSEGNPLFLEEVAKSILESGMLPPTTGASVPDAIRGILYARLDRLEESAKSVLQLASAVGRHVPKALLDDLGPPDVKEALRQLIQARLIRETESGEYVFKNGVTQDVVYHSMLSRQREGLHAQIAAWWEAHGGGVELLAWHYRLAGSKDRAFPLLLQAALRARAKGAPGEALAYLEQAVETADEVAPEALSQVCSEIGEIRLAMGETEAGLVAFQQALALHSGCRAQVVRKNETTPIHPGEWVEIDQLVDPEA